MSDNRKWEQNHINRLILLEMSSFCSHTLVEMSTRYTQYKEMLSVCHSHEALKRRQTNMQRLYPALTLLTQAPSPYAGDAHAPIPKSKPLVQCTKFSCLFLGMHFSYIDLSRSMTVAPHTHKHINAWPPSLLSFLLCLNMSNRYSF